jgi:asparagine N-glycosylation enzyme membrane subunit Stt3
MTAEQGTTGNVGASDRMLDVVLVILLFALAVAGRWVFAKAVVFPPLDDPAFYLKTGENLVDGRGLEVDALWSYQDPALGVTHPSHEHWMPLPTGLIAAAFAVQRFLFGVPEPTFPVGQMPGLILGALLVPLTYVVGRRILPGKGSRWVALVAALLVALNATLAYQSASADSSAPFAFLAAWVLALAVRKPGDTGGYLSTGVLIGLAYLTRSDGLLLLAAIPLAWWLLPAAPSFRLRLPHGWTGPKPRGVGSFYIARGKRTRTTRSAPARVYGLSST